MRKAFAKIHKSYVLLADTLSQIQLSQDFTNQDLLLKITDKLKNLKTQFLNGIETANVNEKNALARYLVVIANADKVIKREKEALITYQKDLDSLNGIYLNLHIKVKLT